MFNFWWSARLVNGLEPHLPPLSSQKNELLIFGLHSTSDDRPSDLSKKRWPKHKKNKKGPLSHWKIKCSFLDYVQLLMISRAIRAKNINQKTQKCPLSHRKIKCSFLDYVQILMIGQSIWAKNINQNTKNNQKGPLNHQTIKCLFLYYIQLLMIGRAIWAKNVNQNAKKWKRPPKSSKNKMFIFGLCSTPDDWRGWSMDSNPVCHPSPAKKMKCSFLDYVQLLMIGWVIWAKNVDRNVNKWKRPPKSSKNKMFVFGLHSTSDDWLSDLSKKCWPKCQ